VEVVESSEEVRLRDAFGKQRLAEGRYTPGQVDVSVWPEEIETDFFAWRREQESRH
jgi:4-hydroxy-4-methyl-2-oxoglutarate aldolase